MKPSLKGKFERRWILGYEGHYAVDVMGTVWTYKRSLTGIPLKANSHKQKSGQVGWYNVNLCKEGRQLIYNVATLVLTTFVGPKPEGCVGCHYDDIPSNNKLSNLRWDTSRANTLDALRNSRGPSQKLSIVEVLEIRERLIRGEAQKLIASRYNVSVPAISDISRGHTWRHV